MAAEHTAGIPQSSYPRESVCPDCARFKRGESLHSQVSPGPTTSAIDRGRRPSLSQIANVQKQHTSEDDDFDEKTNLISPVKQFSKNSPGEEYCDTLGIFSGLRNNYAWCTGTTSRVYKCFRSSQSIIV